MKKGILLSLATALCAIAQTSYYGSGLVLNDSNANLPIFVTGGTPYKVLMSFTASRSGNLTSFRTYLQTGSGYASGTGGKILAKIWPADTSNPPQPIRTGTPLSQGSVQMNLVNGQRSQLSDSWPLFTLTPNAPLTQGQLYFIELQNIDPSPSVNWVSANALCAIDEHVTAVRHTPPPDWAIIWESVSGGVSTFRDLSITHSSGTSSGLYYFPSAEYGYADGSWQGFVRLEPGNYGGYQYAVDSSNPVRERFNISEATTVTGFELHASAQVAGSLSVNFIKNGVTVATATVTQSSANYYTSGPAPSGVFVWYSQNIQPFQVTAGDVLDVQMVAIGSSVWMMSADRTGIDANLGLSAASTFASASAQKLTSGTWRNTLYYDHTGSYPFGTSHFRVILLTSSGTTTDTTPPTVPTGLVSTAVSSSQINLSWSASTDNTAVTGYRVYRGGTQIASVTGTSYQNTGLTANTSYTYTVAAFDAAGNVSAQSAPASATTAAAADTTAPSVPVGLTATVISSSQINLSWSPSTDNVAVTGYRVYRGGTQIASVAGTSFQNTGLAASTSYTYTVAAFDAAGNVSAQSAPASATTAAVADTTAPSVPVGLAATAMSSSQINLSWSASTDNVGVAGYRVYRGGTQIASVAGTSFQNTGLAAGTSYTYTVAAFDAAGNVSAQSGPVTAATLPASPSPQSQLSIQITSPAGSTVPRSASVTLSAAATDTVPVKSISWIVDGTAISGALTGSGSTATSVATWFTGNGRGWHTITATATDSNGTTASATARVRAQ